MKPTIATDTWCDEMSGVILAGGKSTRMGQDKAGLEVGGRSIFDANLSMMTALFQRVIIAGDRPDLCRSGIECCADLYPGSALGGLYTGLEMALTPYILVSTCDMPFPNSGLARLLIGLRRDFDAVVPKTPMGFEPLFAVYRKTCLPFMKAMLEKGLYRIYDFYPQVRVRYVAHHELPDGWEHALINVNTPEQYRSAQELCHGKTDRVHRG